MYLPSVKSLIKWIAQFIGVILLLIAYFKYQTGNLNLCALVAVVFVIAKVRNGGAAS